MVDLTQPISHGDLVWPGDPPTVVEAASGEPMGSASFALNRMGFGEHSGTHIGAPSHYGFAATMDAFDPGLMSGQALFIHCEDCADAEIGAAQIDARLAASGSFSLVVIVTGWARFWGSEAYYFGDKAGGVGTPDTLPAGLDLSAVDYLFDRFSSSIIGIDSPNIDYGGAALSRLDCGFEIARRGAFHLENVALTPSDMPAIANYMLMPLRIGQANGSPARFLVTL